MEHLYDRRPAGGNLPWRSVRPLAVSFLTVRSLIIGAALAFLLACATTGDSSSPFIREDAAPADGVRHPERPADGPEQPVVRPDRVHRPERPADGSEQPAARADRVQRPPVAPADRTERDPTSLTTSAQTTEAGGADPGLGYHRHSSPSAENSQQQLFEAPPPQIVHTADAAHGRGTQPAEAPNETDTDEQVPLLLSPADPHISESPRTLARRHSAGETVSDALSGYHSRRPATGTFTMPMLVPDPEPNPDPVEEASGDRHESDPRSGSESESVSAGESRAEGEYGAGTDPDSPSAPAVPAEPDGSEQPARESPAASETDRSDESRQQPATHPIDGVQDLAQERSDDDEATLESPDGDQEERPTDEEYRVAVGENLSLSLPGDGWLFVGADSAEAVDLVDRRTSGEQTEFEIAIETDGEHRLSFQRQDVGTGAVERHTVRVVGSDDPFDRTPVPDRVPSPAARSVDQSTGIVDVDGVVDLDRIGAPVPDRVDEPAPSHEALVDEYADLDDTELPARLESAVTDAAADRISALLESLRERSFVPQPHLLGDAADVLHAAGRNDAAATAYRWWLSEYEGEVDSGNVHFALAALYEESATTADIRRSVEHYTAVSERYPRNEHASTAESRARHLRRHFVDIR